MKTMDLSQRVRVVPTTSASGVAWSVCVDDECLALHSGEGAKGRALEWALRLAEDLRKNGAVLVEVAADAGAEKLTRVVRSRLAS